MSDRLKWLAQQFDFLVEKLNASPNPKEKTEILRLMRILIVEIDSLISSDLRRDEQESPLSDQSRSASGD